MNSSNKVVKAMYMTGYLQITGAVVLGVMESRRNDSSTTYTFLTAGGIISGMLTIGFGENLKLLSEIRGKLEQQQNVREKVC